MTLWILTLLICIRQDTYWWLATIDNELLGVHKALCTFWSHLPLLAATRALNRNKAYLKHQVSSKASTALTRTRLEMYTIWVYNDSLGITPRSYLCRPTHQRPDSTGASSMMGEVIQTTKNHCGLFTVNITPMYHPPPGKVRFHTAINGGMSHQSVPK